MASLRFVCIRISLVTVFLAAILSQIYGQEGVYLTLNGTTIANHSFVDVDNIGEGDAAALLCRTNKTDCCTSKMGQTKAGEWHFSCNQDMEVGILGDPPLADNLFYRNRNKSVVRLNRHGNPSERGCFRCEVPDANDVHQIVFTNIVDIDTIMISLSARIIGYAGVATTLTCSTVIASGSPPQAVIFEWFFASNANSALPSGVTSYVTENDNNYMSILEFSPLQSTHAGLYTCQFGDNQKLRRDVLVTVIKDYVTVGFEQNSYTIMEGYTVGVCLNVTVKGIVNRAVMVNVSTADHSTVESRGYTPIDMTLEINMSTNVLCVNITTVYDDDPMNLDEIFHVSLSSNDPVVFIPKERAITLVIIENIPPPEVEPMINKVTEGMDAIFTLKFSGDSEDFQWQFNEADIKEENAMVTLNLTIINVTEMDEGNYTCIVTFSSFDGNITSKRAELLVFSPPIINTLLLNKIVSLGDSTNFSVNASGDGLTYQWQRNDENISGDDGRIEGVLDDTLIIADTKAEDAGVYKCIVINGAGDSITSNEATLTVFSPPSITNYSFESNSISIYWKQEDVESYKIQYNFTIRQCADEMATQITNDELNMTIVTNNYYIINNGADMPVEEDSDYIISLFAVKSGVSSPAAIIVNSTKEAAPSGAPVSVRNTSSSSTSITITWDRVACDQRNGEIDGYNVTYYPKDDESDKITAIVYGVTESNRAFLASGLQHLTNYTFEVLAFNGIGYGPEATATFQTLISEGLEISNDSTFIVGENAVINCTTAIVVKELLWLDEQGHVLVNSSSNTTATLEFNPVNDSIHNKTFTCRAIQTGMVDKHIKINVSAPSYSVVNATITHSLNKPIVGEPYNLTCLYNVSKGFTHKPSVCWKYPNGTNLSSSLIVFDALHASDRGNYTCEVIFTSPVLKKPNVTVQTYNLTIQLPSPNVSISVPNATLHAGTTVNLTCFVTLARNIDVNITLNVTWLRNSVNTTTLLIAPTSNPITNILTLFQLSAMDENITCLVRILPTEEISLFLTESSPRSVSISLAIKTTVGVFLQLRGEIIPNNSLVNLNDLQYHTNNDQPTNANGQQTLMCVTDHVDCCDTEQLGNWYYPDGRTVVYSTEGGHRFQSNRGQNEALNGQQFYGSVRLWRRFTPTERGLFRCELPDAENVVQTLYVNILFFTLIAGSYKSVSVTSSLSGSSTAGETYSLTCSATLHFNNPPSPDSYVTPSPTFQWFFGPNGDATFPSGLTPGPTVLSSGIYTSTLQFSPLSQSHTGNYTCRLGAGSLVNSAMVTVNAPVISVQITTSGAPMLGQSGYSLTCNVSPGAENLNSSITYQWTKNNGTQTQIQVRPDPKVLSFSLLRLSDTGRYTCQATVSSTYLNNSITRMDSIDVTLQIPAPTSIMLSSSVTNPIRPVGSEVTLTCTVELTSVIDVPVTVNMVMILPAGFMTTNTAQPVMGSNTTYSSTATVSSFGRSDSGVYTCRAIVSSASANTYIRDSNTESHAIRVTTGIYLALRGVHIANNSQVNIKSIDQSSDSPNGALQCITDRIPCCFSPDHRHGKWHLPNGELVQGTTSNTAFYSNRGDNGEVSLNRPSDVMSPTGRFCCEVADAADTNQTLCVNIGGLSIMISGSATAGESYTLECSVGGSEGTFQWLKGQPDGRKPVVSSGSIIISSSSTTSQLQFRPVQQSDNGSYLCSATVGGLALSSESVLIVVNAPSLSVQISNIVATPTAEENYLLTCSVSGAENLSPTITYRWTKNNGTQTQVGTNSNTLFFTPLRLSDAASYGCEVTISSSYLSGYIVGMNANTQDVRIQIPTPSSLILSSDNANIVMVGFDVTLTCALELNSAILASDLSLLMVDVQLFKDGTPLSNPSMSPMTGTTLTYTIQLNSFRRSDSGNYTCRATIRPQPNTTYLTGNEMLQSDTINIKAASAPPLNVRAIQSSSSSPVEVSWSPPSDGVNTITGYRIYYGNGQNVLVPSVTVITLVGLEIDGNYVGQNVSIRSESDELNSELVNVSVTIDNVGAVMCFSSCSSEVGTAVGAVIVVVCLVVIVIIVIVVLCLWRKKSSNSANNKSDFTVSVNMAYGEVSLKPRETEGEYENPANILKPSGEWNEATVTNTYEAMDTRNPAAPEYASTEEAIRVTHHSS